MNRGITLSDVPGQFTPDVGRADSFIPVATAVENPTLRLPALGLGQDPEFAGSSASASLSIPGAPGTAPERLCGQRPILPDVGKFF